MSIIKAKFRMFSIRQQMNEEEIDLGLEQEQQYRRSVNSGRSSNRLHFRSRSEEFKARSPPPPSSFRLQNGQVDILNHLKVRQDQQTNKYPMFVEESCSRLLQQGKCKQLLQFYTKQKELALQQQQFQLKRKISEQQFQLKRKISEQILEEFSSQKDPSIKVQFGNMLVAKEGSTNQSLSREKLKKPRKEYKKLTEEEKDRLRQAIIDQELDQKQILRKFKISQSNLRVYRRKFQKN